MRDSDTAPIVVGSVANWLDDPGSVQKTDSPAFRTERSP